MTKQKFMVIDLFIFSVIAIILQMIEMLAIKLAPSILFYLSFSLIVVLIAMFRWGIYGILVGIIPILLHCYMVGADGIQYIVYLMGLIPILLNLYWFKVVPKKTMSKNLLSIILYTITGYGLVLLGRSIIAMIFSYSFFTTLNQFLLNESLSIVIGCLVMVIAYAQKTILVEVNQYLLNLHKEEIENE